MIKYTISPEVAKGQTKAAEEQRRRMVENTISRCLPLWSWDTRYHFAYGKCRILEGIESWMPGFGYSWLFTLDSVSCDMKTIKIRANYHYEEKARKIFTKLEKKMPHSEIEVLWEWD